MKTKRLLIAPVILSALLLACCSVKETSVLEVPEKVQAGDLTGLTDCEFQHGTKKSNLCRQVRDAGCSARVVWRDLNVSMDLKKACRR